MHGVESYAIYALRYVTKLKAHVSTGLGTPFGVGMIVLKAQSRGVCIYRSIETGRGWHPAQRRHLHDLLDVGTAYEHTTTTTTTHVITHKANLEIRAVNYINLLFILYKEFLYSFVFLYNDIYMLVRSWCDQDRKLLWRN